jgi:hypothetical protein
VIHAERVYSLGGQAARDSRSLPQIAVADYGLTPVGHRNVASNHGCRDSPKGMPRESGGGRMFGRRFPTTLIASPSELAIHELVQQGRSIPSDDNESESRWPRLLEQRGVPDRPLAYRKHSPVQFHFGRCDRLSGASCRQLPAPERRRTAVVLCSFCH